MKKIVLFLLLIIPVCINAQYLGDEHSYVTAGSNVKFRPYTYDEKMFLVMEFTNHDKYSLSGYPIVKFQMKDGSVLKLEGVVENSETSNSAYKIGYAIISSSSTSYCVALPITKEEIEEFKKGVERISINTLPVVYKRSKWSGKKSFGEDLYKNFQNLKGDFEE